MPEIRRSCRAFISARTVPVTPIPPILAGGVAPAAPAAAPPGVVAVAAVAVAVAVAVVAAVVVDRLEAPDSSPSICFKSDSDSDLDLPADFRWSASGKSLEKELRRDLATGDLAGGGDDTPSPVGEGLGFLPNIDESNLTPIPLLINSYSLKNESINQ